MKEKKRLMPPEARYPLFLAGLLIIIAVGVVALRQNFSLTADLAIGTIGFIFLVLSVAIR